MRGSARTCLPAWSPIGTLEGIQDTIRAKKTLEVLGDRLRRLHAHDALCLLRHAFAIPKLLYVIHTSPCFLSPELQSFDSLVRSLLCAILNIRLNDSAWTQASLPTWCGDLGVCSAIQLAPSAYLASAAGSRTWSNRSFHPDYRMLLVQK